MNKAVLKRQVCLSTIEGSIVVYTLMCDCGYIVIIMRYGTSMEGVSSQVAEKMVVA